MKYASGFQYASHYNHTMYILIEIKKHTGKI